MSTLAARQRASRSFYEKHKDDPEFRKNNTQAALRYFQTDKGKIAKRRAKLMHAFGMTLEEYDALHEKQKGLCAICGRPQIVIRTNSRPINRLAVDHDHDTKENRGLLCSICNRSLGGFQDSPDVLRRALAYLAEWGKT